MAPQISTYEEDDAFGGLDSECLSRRFTITRSEHVQVQAIWDMLDTEAAQQGAPLCFLSNPHAGRNQSDSINIEGRISLSLQVECAARRIGLPRGAELRT